MKTTILFLLMLAANLSFAQVVFSETFDEADDATTGSDAIGAVTWTATCPGSVALTDYFKVLSGKLEARDTNSPAAQWETADIDISSCTEGLRIAVEIEEAGTMEACIDCGGTGTICIDWVKIEYNLDAGGWTEAVGVTCALAESPGELLFTGDLHDGDTSYTSPCIDIGTTLQIRISCMSWAANEYWYFDDITVECDACLLPVEVIDLKATQTEIGTTISWSTLTERSSDYFTVERSTNGLDFELFQNIEAAGNSTSQIDYTTEDLSFQTSEIVYYRLRQFDLDGKEGYSEVISIQRDVPYATVFYGNESIQYQIQNTTDKTLAFNIYDINGRRVHQSMVTNSGEILWKQTGFYIVEIPAINYRQKLVVSPK